MGEGSDRAERKGGEEGNGMVGEMGVKGDGGGVRWWVEMKGE